MSTALKIALTAALLSVVVAWALSQWPTESKVDERLISALLVAWCAIGVIAPLIAIWVTE